MPRATPLEETPRAIVALFSVAMMHASSNTYVPGAAALRTETTACTVAVVAPRYVPSAGSAVRRMLDTPPKSAGV